MKKTARLFSVVLATAMLFGGCSQGTSNNSPKDTSSATSSAAQTANTTSKEVKEITFVKNVDADAENRLIPNLKDGETLEKNRWTDLIEQKLGYKVVYKWITDNTDQYNQKFNAMVATGDIPDIVELNNLQLKQLVESGVLQDIKGAYDSNASDLLKSIVTGGGEAAVEAAKFNGVQYGIPRVDADIERSSILWVRTDWLKKTGKSAPKTIDELVDLAKEFNKIAGSGAVGIAFRGSQPIGKCANYTIEGFMNAFGAYPNEWVERDGKLVYGNTLPEFRKGIEKMAEMYSQGLLDKEFIVKDESKVNEAIVSGKCGIFYGAHWSALSPLQDNVNNFPEADWMPYEIPTVDGSAPIVGTELASSTWFCVSKNCKYPEALVQLLNLFTQTANEPVGDEYVKYHNGGGDLEGIWKLCPVTILKPNKNIAITREIDSHLRSGDAGNLFGESLSMFNYSYQAMQGDRKQWGWNRIFGIDGSCSIQGKEVDEKRTYMSKFYGAPTKTMSTKSSILDKAFEEAVLKAISGQMSMEKFDAAVKAWYDGGGTQITDEVNEWYKSQK